MTDMAKKLRKRWGKKYVDARDWPVYNEQLVRRGEYLLDLEWVRNWDVELREMNRNKRGHPYEFPDSLIRLQSVWHDKNIPVRMIEGVTRKLFQMAHVPSYNDYTTISRRINQLDFHLDLPDGDGITIFCDGSGFQAINGGEYLREKYGKRNRQWVQVIILGDSETKEPVSFEVNLVPTSEPESAKRQLRKLIDHDVDVTGFGGDGAFDEIDLWRLLESNEIQPVIKPDLNARDDSPSPARNTNVKERNSRGYKRWASNHGYGARWPATEGIFSAIKRVFGEQLAAPLIREFKYPLRHWQCLHYSRSTLAISAAIHRLT
jgi:hypothetical protein